MRRWNGLCFARCALVASLLAGAALPAVAQAEFPYDRDLVYDARPMRGSKRVPVLSIDGAGRAQIDLWCKRGQGEAIIAGDSITILVGAMREEACSAERAQADEEMIATLGAVTSWSLRGETLTLSGAAATLRFRAASN